MRAIAREGSRRGSRRADRIPGSLPLALEDRPQRSGAFLALRAGAGEIPRVEARVDLPGTLGRRGLHLARRRGEHALDRNEVDTGPPAQRVHQRVVVADDARPGEVAEEELVV